MTTLTLADLTLDSEAGENHPLDSTTVAYIQSLVEPYYSKWFQPAGNLHTLNMSIRAFRREFPSSMIFPSDYAFVSTNLADELDRVIKVLGLSLSVPAIEYVEAHEFDTVVLPWDVVDGVIDQAPETAEVFGFSEDVDEYNRLPVTVTVNRRLFTHSMTKMMAFGLVLFSRVTGFDFAPEMFGVPFSYFDDTETRHRFFEYTWTEGRTGYHVTIEGKDYYFSSQEEVTRFLHGFSTGALWAGVDHHAYWSNFYREDYRGERSNLTF